MKTLKIFSIGFLICVALVSTSQAQAYVTFNAGVIAPYGYYPPAGYVQVYGGPVMYGYPGGCNRGYYGGGYYNNYYRQPYYGGGYRPHCGGYGYGRGHHGRCY
jgi:hypothetical protein